jgi:membrane-bound ClpP family serine protease
MTTLFSIDPATVDPNVIFLALIVSLWLGVTAAYIPGTGVIEGMALVALTGVLIVLLQLEIQWAAVLLIVLGISVFSVVPFINPRYAPWALTGLGLQAAGSSFLFQDASVNGFVILLTLLLPLGYYWLVLLPMLENARHQPVIHKDDLLIGAEGRVTRAIDPVGAVHVNSESWSATSDQHLPVGTRVRVIDKRGLQLVVEGIKEKRREDFVVDSDATEEDVT